MSEPLAKMEKPEASQFKEGRKLFFVPLILKSMEEDATLSELTHKYWKEVDSQLKNLESSLSDIKKIYHELVPGEAGVKRLKDLSIGSYNIVESLRENGAVLTAIEDSSIMDEFIDWGRCLSMGLRSPAVFTKVYEAYQEAEHKRDEHIAKRIDETLSADETGVLFMREGHHVQFPADVQVFYVAPPSLDALQRALREQQEQAFGKQAEGATEETEKEAETSDKTGTKEKTEAPEGKKEPPGEEKPASQS